MADPVVTSAPVAKPAVQRDPSVTAAYAKMRERAQQGVQSQGQQAGDELKRNFARMGGLNSGAFIKQQNMLQDRVTEQAGQATAGIDLAEAQSNEQFAEAERGRSFASSEAEKGRQFQAGQADKDMAFRQQLFDFDKTTKLRALDMADKEFSRDSETLDFNRRQAAYQMGLTVEDLMSPGGPRIMREQEAARLAKEAQESQPDYIANKEAAERARAALSNTPKFSGR